MTFNFARPTYSFSAFLFLIMAKHFCKALPVTCYMTKNYLIFSIYEKEGEVLKSIMDFLQCCVIGPE